MAVARSLAQQQLRIESKKIKARRDREAMFWVVLEFLSAISTSLVIMDALGILGVSITVGVVFTAPVIVFFSVLALTIACGVICGVYAVVEAMSRRDAELRLMQDHTEKVEKHDCKLAKLQDLLRYSAEFDPVITKHYQQILQNEKIDENIHAISKHLNKAMNDNLADLLPLREKPVKYKKIEVPVPSYMFGRVIAFFSGAGFTAGILATIIGVASLPTLLLTPVGWLILGSMVALTLLTGYIMQRFDFHARWSQQTHMEELQNGVEKLDNQDHMLSKTIERVKAAIIIHERGKSVDAEHSPVLQPNRVKATTPGLSGNLSTVFSVESQSPLLKETVLLNKRNISLESQ